MRGERQGSWPKENSIQPTSHSEASYDADRYEPLPRPQPLAPLSLSPRVSPNYQVNVSGTTGPSGAVPPQVSEIASSGFADCM